LEAYLTTSTQKCDYEQVRDESQLIYRDLIDQDDLATIGDIVKYFELVTTTLNGFPPLWDPFVKGICARRKLPKFDKLWAYFSQEESRLIPRNKR
jgi:hypothetical protein